MGWAVGYDSNWKRDIGYGVPAKCDHPDCDENIDRGLSYVCGDDVYGGEQGCGLFFCCQHQVGGFQKCERCVDGKPPFKAKPDILQWREWKKLDPSWATWRADNPEEAAAL